MGHPKIVNNTPFEFESLFLNDEDNRPLFVPLIKATYRIVNINQLVIAEEQTPIDFGGTFFFPDSEEGSYKYEPEFAFIKPNTDIVLVGSAYAPKPGSTEVNVCFRVGAVEKIVTVLGDRVWDKVLGITRMSDPQPFESIPLVYERAFGGWDRTHEDFRKHRYEEHNPVGVGFHCKKGKFQNGSPAPNLEDPKKRIKGYHDTPTPAGFGFTSPNWQPRASFAGTYDETWTKERMPLLPNDFDRRYFNTATSDLIAPAYLKGNEPVVIDNASPEGQVTFNLPGVPPPTVSVRLNDQGEEELKTVLDTVVVNLDENLLFLTWRGHMPVRNVPDDVEAVTVTAEGVASPVREL